MQKLNLPSYNFRIKGEGSKINIFDTVRKKFGQLLLNLQKLPDALLIDLLVLFRAGVFSLSPSRNDVIHVNPDRFQLFPQNLCRSCSAHSRNGSDSSRPWPKWPWQELTAFQTVP